MSGPLFAAGAWPVVGAAVPGVLGGDALAGDVLLDVEEPVPNTVV